MKLTIFHQLTNDYRKIYDFSDEASRAYRAVLPMMPANANQKDH
jgi:hypothetical protein